MRRIVLSLLLGLVVSVAAVAEEASKWSVSGAPDNPPFTLMLPHQNRPFFVFDCSARDHVKVTQTGVTKLLDMKTNKHVGDGPNDVLTPGAAYMAIGVNDVEPNLVPAKGTHNPAGGWDLVIEIPKSEPAFVALGKAKMMTLFTTGHTVGVVLSDADRAVVGDFVSRCRAHS